MAEELKDEADVRSQRSQLLAAVAAANATVLKNVLDSLSANAGSLEMEFKAANAALEVLHKLDQATSALEDEKLSSETLRKHGESESLLRIDSEKAAQAAAAQQQATLAQLQAELRVARGQGPVSSDAELAAISQETRINELQAVIVSLQTQIRQAEMKNQQLTMELANAKEAAGPTLKAMKATEDELAHTQRLLRTSEASNATLLTQIAAFQQRHAGVATGETRPPKPPLAPRATHLDDLQQPPTLSDSGVARPEDGGAAAAAMAVAAAADAAAVSSETTAAFLGADSDAMPEEMPTSLEELQQALRHERGRVRLLSTEVRTIREESEGQLERQRRGADRSLREMQTEFARMHRQAAETREAIQAADGRAKGEVGFRRRAEQGWLNAQQTLERTQAELHSSRVQVSACIPRRRRGRTGCHVSVAMFASLPRTLP